MTLNQAAEILHVNSSRVSQLIKAGRLPGSFKFQPSSNMKAFWKIPIDSLTALVNSRRIEQGLEPYGASSR